jgi:hypothetical protein
VISRTARRKKLPHPEREGSEQSKDAPRDLDRVPDQRPGD